ncbi:hypothetical protein G6F56_003855 [Rhizopus delemar]|nr:hypothetical protein G6F56_003855 [Rhizopus delemar]
MSESSHRSLKRPSLLETPQSLIFTGTEDNNPGRSIRRRVDYRSPISRTSFRSTGSPEEWMGSPFSGERHEFELEARPTRNSPYNTGNSTHNTRNSVYSTGNSTQSTGTIERNIASLHISQYPLTQTAKYISYGTCHELSSCDHKNK